MEELNIKELQQEILKDLNFNLENAGIKLLRVPSMRQKYAAKLLVYQKKLDDLEFERKELYASRWRYYSMDYNQELDRRDIPTYIEGDVEYTSHMKKVNKAKYFVDLIDNACKAIDGLNWNIPMALKWEMFKQGA